jgi:hypothetical protein
MGDEECYVVPAPTCKTEHEDNNHLAEGPACITSVSAQWRRSIIKSTKHPSKNGC